MSVARAPRLSRSRRTIAARLESLETRTLLSAAVSYYGFDSLYSFGMSSAISSAVDAQGNIFGETQVAGNTGGKCFSVGGCGTIFRIDAATGAFSTLHQFNWFDGTLPFAGLVGCSSID